MINLPEKNERPAILQFQCFTTEQQSKASYRIFNNLGMNILRNTALLSAIMKMSLPYT